MFTRCSILTVLTVVVTMILGFRTPLRAASIDLQFQASAGTEPIQRDQVITRNAVQESLSLSRLDFLISDLELHSRDGVWKGVSNWAAFLSLTTGRTNARVEGIAQGNYDQVRFQVGIPSVANHSNPATYGPDHPLNPVLNGLHWNWQGGYIFLAIEGRWHRSFPGTPTNLSGTANGYSFHLANDWNRALVTLPIDIPLKVRHRIDIQFDVIKLLRGLEFQRDGTSTHSRREDNLAATLRTNLQHTFRVHSDGPGTTVRSNSIATIAAKLDLPRTVTPFRFQVGPYFSAPRLPVDNPLINERIALGEFLFHENRLSRDGTISCASCHLVSAAMSDRRRFSQGVQGRVGQRQSMPLFNLAWKSKYFWDGRAPSLREQALMPIQDHLELDESLDNIVQKLKSDAHYPQRFQAAFGSGSISAETIGLALESFLLVQTSHDSKFDRSLSREETLSAEEQRGMELFFTEYDPRREQYGADCFHCHGGAHFTSFGFANNGLDNDPKDPGRFRVTQSRGDMGKFAIPSLRNIELTAPYMHDGRFQTLEAVVEHYTSGVKPHEILDPNLAKHPSGGVPLSTADQRALVTFLRTLTDPKFASKSSNEVAVAQNPAR